MPRQSYEIEGEFFATKKALRERIQTILNGVREEADLDEADFRFLCAVLTHHPRAEEKIGIGIRRMWAQVNPPFPTRGFWLERHDGTRSDWSFYECLHASSPFSDFRAACRNAIQDQKLRVRDAFFASGAEPRCPITGQILTTDTCHVDHEAPATFDTLVAGFVAAARIDLLTVALGGKGDGEVDLCLADPVMRQLWRDYHATHARMRVLDAGAHLRLPRGRLAR